MSVFFVSLAILVTLRMTGQSIFYSIRMTGKDAYHSNVNYPRLARMPAHRTLWALCLCGKEVCIHAFEGMANE